MGIHTYGLNAVDWEQRVDYERLRTDRLARLQAELDRSELGALLTFDFHNIRYMTATHIGTWAHGQDDPLRVTDARRAAHRLGLRFGGATPPDVQPVA